MDQICFRFKDDWDPLPKRMMINEARIVYRPVQSGKPLPLLDSPERIVEYMEGAFDEDPTVEWFSVVMLNRKNRGLGRTMVTKGTATASLVHVREVFKPVILASACAFVCCHNHPSGDPSPSQADIRATRQIREAAKVMQIDFLDHIVIGTKEHDPTNQGWYSFAEAGLV